MYEFSNFDGKKVNMSLPPKTNLDWLMKSYFADLCVKNSGLNTMFKLLNWACNILVVPGIIVERIKIILSFLLLLIVYV